MGRQRRTNSTGGGWEHVEAVIGGSMETAISLPPPCLARLLSHTSSSFLHHFSLFPLPAFHSYLGHPFQDGSTRCLIYCYLKRWPVMQGSTASSAISSRFILALRYSPSLSRSSPGSRLSSSASKTTPTDTLSLLNHASHFFFFHSFISCILNVFPSFCFRFALLNNNKLPT